MIQTIKENKTTIISIVVWVLLFVSAGYIVLEQQKAIQLAREADSIDGMVDLPIVLNYPNADNSDLQIKWTEEEIIQFLQQPKEITKIEFEMEINQCDGCMSNYPIINGVHQIPYPSGKMVCKANLYNNLKITKSIKYPNGLLTIKNVKVKIDS